MRSPRFVAHMAVLSGDHAPNSIAAIHECLAAGVERIEIDIHSLAGDDYIVSHDRRLDDNTTGAGAMGAVSPGDVRASRFRAGPDDRPALLSEVVDAARGASTEIQLDLKDWRPMTLERIRALDEIVKPIRGRVIVSSGQDWNLLRLTRSAPDIETGFDPGWYLAHVGDDSDAVMPRARSAYGFLDDHPLAYGRTGATAHYLEQRFELFLLQAPASGEYFLSYRLALQMLDDGFNAAEFLHTRGIDANVWTHDYEGPESVFALARLLDAGFDRVTTNTTLAWQRAFAER